VTLGIFSGTTQRWLDFAAGATFAVAECSHRAEGVAPRGAQHDPGRRVTDPG
jgi:hypothetical protein